MFGRPPESPTPNLKFKSLKELEKGEKMPYNGWAMNDSDYQKLLEVLAELERKTDK